MQFYIHHLYNYQIIYIISYILDNCSIQPEIIIFNPDSCDTIQNTPESFILFTLITPKDLIFLHDTILTLRKKFQKLDAKIVAGGALLHVIDGEQLRHHYPEITYLCIGKGEEVFKYIITSLPPEGVYRDRDFPKIKNSPIHNSLLPRIGRAYVTLNDNRCSWNRCMFCHHHHNYYAREKITIEELGEQIIYYLKHEMYNIELYDNEVQVHDLICLLDYLKNRGVNGEINIKIFGMRFSGDFSVLNKSLDRWEETPVKTVCWGIEFFDQEILDLYQKGIYVDEIPKVLGLFHSLGIQNIAYILLGLPRVLNRHIENLLQFKMQYGHLISYFRPSFFRLSSATRIWKETDKYGIRITSPYLLNDLAPAPVFPDIETIYYRFTSLDEDDNQWKTRQEVFEKYKKLNCLFDLDQHRVIFNY